MNLNKKNKKRIANKSINPKDFIDRFCDKLNIDVKKIEEIYDLCLKNNIIFSKYSTVNCTGCIYFHIKKNNLDITKGLYQMFVRGL